MWYFKMFHTIRGENLITFYCRQFHFYPCSTFSLNSNLSLEGICQNYGQNRPHQTECGHDMALNNVFHYDIWWCFNSSRILWVDFNVIFTHRFIFNQFIPFHNRRGLEPLPEYIGQNTSEHPGHPFITDLTQKDNHSHTHSYLQPLQSQSIWLA